MVKTKEGRAVTASGSDPSPRDQALAWFVRMQSGDADVAEREEFVRWLGLDAAHRREYEGLAALWSDLDAVPDPRPTSASTRPAPSRRWVLSRGAMLALGGGALIGAGAFAVLPPSPGGRRTVAGRRETFVAEDGSRIELDADSAVDLDYAPGRRRVVLRRGRALFAAAPDPTAPFQVVCDHGLIQAVGTVFTVCLRSAHAEISVEEGEVLVSGAAGAPLRLEAGRKVRLKAGGPGAATAAKAGDSAWRRGRLVFEDDPLAEVVEDLDRYRSGRIVLWDKDIAALRVGGVFDTARPETALNAIVDTLPVRRIDVGPWMTILRRA